MFRFLIIESKSNDIFDDGDIISLFSEFINISHLIKEQHRLILYFEGHEDLVLEDVIINMMTDAMTDLRMYVSHTYFTENERKEACTFIMNMLPSIPFGTYYYLDNARLVTYFTHQISDEFRRFILRKYTDDPIMMETLHTYFESNLNMMTAAKKLYIHRNTLIQRIDKFFQVTGFDPRKFMDAHLIYLLIT